MIVAYTRGLMSIESRSSTINKIGPRIKIALTQRASVCAMMNAQIPNNILENLVAVKPLCAVASTATQRGATITTAAG